METLEAGRSRTDQLPELRPQGQWALAWRRLRRDRVAVGCGIFLLFLVFAVGPGAPLYGMLVGHGPNQFFPYAVSVGLRPAGPFTVTWDTPEVAGDDPFRNAIAPIVTMTAMDAGMAIGIAMYIETVFALPGLGRTLIRALAGFQGYDLPVILAVTLVAAAAIILLNFVADLVLIALDPTVARRGRGVQRVLGRAA